MSDPREPRPQSETDQTITDLGRGKAERVALGNNPYGSIGRIVLVVILFVVVFGTIFYFAGRG